MVKVLKKPKRGKPFSGKPKLNRTAIDALADELVEWMYSEESVNNDEWQIEKFSTMKKIPYHYFTKEFIEQSPYFLEQMNLCEDLKRIRFVKQVTDKKIPPTFGIFASKNELDYRDRISSDDKKGTKKEQPTKDGVKSAIGKAKDKYFSRPD